MSRDDQRFSGLTIVKSVVDKYHSSLTPTVPRDPVCGMEVSEESKFKSRNGGQTIYFCCPHCKSKFDAEPAKFD
jgi:YHS domain-containing protein